LKVLFLPKATNPYQYLLAQALVRVGVVVKHQSNLPSELWLIQNRGQVQILHMHWPSDLYAWGVLTPIRFLRFVQKLVLARFWGYKIVWTMHNIIPHQYTFPGIDIIGRFIIASLSNVIIVHCEHAKNELEKRFFRKKEVYVIPHGNYITRYPHSMSREEARQLLGIDADAFVYLYFGKILPYKNLDRLMRAFDQLGDENTVLVIGGKCDLREQRTMLGELAKGNERIKLFTEFIPDEMVQQLFFASDVFVVPFSRILTSGSVILGLSFGLPVVAPKLGCLPELITPRTGILYDPQDYNGLLCALRTIRHMDMKMMNVEAYRLALTLDWRMIGERTHQAYLKSRR